MLNQLYIKRNRQNRKEQSQKFSTQKIAGAQKKSNIYKPPSGYVANPFDSLYQDYDVEISDRDDIALFHDRAIELSECIEGDFDLDELVHRIKTNNLAFAETGLIAFKIREMRLYKKLYSNFTDFCHIVLNKSRSYIDRLIRASVVIVELVRNGFEVLPANESQCRILSKYVGSELVRIWRAIVETIEPHKITVESIKAFLSDEEETVEPSSEFIRLPGYLSEHITRYALSIGMTAQDLVVMLLEQIFKPAKPKTNWRDFEREEEWQLDLEKLIEEGENILDSS